MASEHDDPAADLSVAISWARHWTKGWVDKRHKGMVDMILEAAERATPQGSALENARSVEETREALKGRHPVFAFLLGVDQLEGRWFGDKHPTEKGAFWWRKHLRRALAWREQEGS